MKRTALILLFLLGRTPALPAEEKLALSPQQAEAIDAVVQREMERLHIPGLSLAIARGGVLVHSRVFGRADVENDVPARPETRFRTASVAKSLTATAVMRLVEKGQLDLDAPIQKYCPAFPEKPWPVTARQLLTHTAGVRHYSRPGESRGTDHFFTVADSLRLFKDDPLLFEPGTQFGYSTYGYNVLGCAIEGASGMDYDTFLAKAVLGPAGMTATGPDDQFLILPGRANGYMVLSEEDLRGLPPSVRSQAKPGQLLNAPLHDTSMKRPAGGLLSTAEDLARFALAFEAGKLVSPDTVRQMWTVQKTRDGADITTPWGPLGIGWFVKKNGPLTEIYSSGGQIGGRSSLYVYPESGTVLAVMTNLTNAEIVPMEREILQILMPEVPVEPDRNKNPGQP
ncbi:MAG TPA: serine hydrolase domain-containing protein [Thermoanaerobaculia bacterium]|nr:serine hydrolase domain-containing protein [Thermoanaerobaculia bacterium]